MLVVAGNVTLDDTVLPDGRAAMGVVGGDVLYTGLGAALWTRPVGLVSRVGDDVPADALDAVRAAGLDVAGIQSVAGPTIRYWIIYEWDGRRHFIFRTPEERFAALSPWPDDVPAAYTSAARAIHVAALPIDQAEALVRAAAALGARPLVTLDTHEDFVAGYQERLAALLPLLAAFLPSREEVALWFGEADRAPRVRGDAEVAVDGVVQIEEILHRQGKEASIRLARHGHDDVAFDAEATGEADIAGEVGTGDEALLDGGGGTGSATGRASAHASQTIDRACAGWTAGQVTARAGRVVAGDDAHAAATARALAAARAGDVQADPPGRLEDAVAVLDRRLTMGRQERYRVRTRDRLGQPVQVEHDPFARRFVPIHSDAFQCPFRQTPPPRRSTAAIIAIPWPLRGAPQGCA